MKCKECGQDIGQYEVYDHKGRLVIRESTVERAVWYTRDGIEIKADEELPGLLSFGKKGINIVRTIDVQTYTNLYLYDNVTEHGYHVRLENP